jgi:sRNA-binding regulator protein Hfq
VDGPSLKVSKKIAGGTFLQGKRTTAIVACLVLVSVTSGHPGAAASEEDPNLIDLALQRFPTPTAAQRKLFQKVAKGELADYSAEAEEDNDPADANNWGPERVLDANSIAWLCTDKQASALVTHRGIWLKGARIEGWLDLEFAKILFPLVFERSSIPQEMNLGDVEIPALHLPGTHTGPIKADGLKVAGCVFLRNGFRAEGEVRLVGATIGGNLECKGSQFINPNRYALNGYGLKVEGNVRLDNEFKAEGEVCLVGATIGKTLVCDGGKFIESNRCALNGDRLKVEGNVFLRNGFRAEGEVCLVTATIGGNLECQGSQFIKPTGGALYGDGLKVAGSVFLDDDFKAEGEVELTSMTIGRFFRWKGVDSPENVELDLRYAKIGILWDDKNSWPKSGKLFLDGLAYDAIYEEAPTDVNSRIEWLRLQYDGEAEGDKDQFRPQPYEQLAAVFRRSGRDIDAKKILIAKNEDKERLTKLTLGQWLWYRVFGPIIGYGYQPWRALWIGLLFVLLGWLLFRAGYRAEVITAVKQGEDASGGFSALVYSFDVFVPLVDLRQASHWLPNAKRKGELRVSEKFRLPVSGKVLRCYMWFETVAGWVLTMLLVAGLTGLVRT